jgi:hypothetical protein
MGSRKVLLTSKLSRLGFYSSIDRDVMLRWLDRINCVSAVNVVGRTLCFDVDTAELNETDMTELMSLYRRYRIDMDSLVDLIKPEFVEWLDVPGTYWYRNMFKRRGPRSGLLW